MGAASNRSPKTERNVNVSAFISLLLFLYYIDEKFCYRSLLTNESLYSIFSQNLSPTNVYLEFELFDNPMTSTRSSQDSKSNMYPKEFSAIPSSCKDIQINLIHKRKPESENMIFKCCKDLHIFEDNISPYLKNSTSPSGFYGGKKSNFFNQDVGWWESEVIVRGFKEQSIKGQNIWK